MAERLVDVTPNQRFLHGENAYEKGVPRSVPESLADYFYRQGWIGVMSKPVVGEVTLDIHSSTLGHDSRFGE